MELGDRLGILGILVGIVALGITILWPTKRWIGYSCFVVAALLLGWWCVTEYRAHHKGEVSHVSSGDGGNNGNSSQRTSSPPDPQPKKSPERIFTDKTPLELVRFFREGYTSIQSHELFDPYVGMWMHLHGRIVDTYPGNPGHGAIDVWYSPSLFANCYFANGWADEASRHIKGEEISIDGKIADFQTGNNQFFLTDCELPGVKISRDAKSSSNPRPIVSLKRVFTDKSIPDLMGLYRHENTGMQNDKIITPFKGLWIKSQGTIQYLAPDYKDHSIAVIIVSSWPVECRFPPSQKADLTRFSNNDTIQFTGKIAENQTSQELYLQTCELIKQP